MSWRGYAGTVVVSNVTMRACLLVLVIATGCTGSSEDDDGAYTHVHITSTPPFDRLAVYWMDWGRPYVLAPLTPDMLRTGEPRPIGYVIGASYSPQLVDAYTLSTPRTSFDKERWQIADDYALVAAVGFAGDSVVGGAAAEPNYKYVDSAYHADVELVLGAAVEQFGADQECLRVSYAMPQPDIATFYAVHPDDTDCDGMDDNVDCQPSVTCTSDVPSSCSCP